jgi:hypothetical protein
MVASARQEIAMRTLGLLFLCLPGVSLADTVYDDEADFLAATGAVLTVDFPAPTTAAPSYTENGVVITQVDGYSLSVFDDRSAATPGNELGVSGPESIDILLPEPQTTFGMYIEDSTTDPNSLSVCPKLDSTFTFTFLDETGMVVGEVNVAPPSNQTFFVGVALDAPFDLVEIREDGALPGDNVGPHCENDYFGDIFTGGALQTCDASLVEVAAFEDSSAVTPRSTGIYVEAGQLLTISADPFDDWSAGSGCRDSGPDGLGEANPFGCTFPCHDADGASYLFGSLVGRIGDGPWFLVGSGYEAPADRDGELTLAYWDSNQGDNSGSVSALVSVDCEPTGLGLPFDACDTCTDGDGDGVCDTDDTCLGTPSGVVDVDGCSIEDRCPCDAAWRHRGEYLECLLMTAGTFADEGLLELSDVGEIALAAASDSCGRAPGDTLPTCAMDGPSWS